MRILENTSSMRASGAPASGPNDAPVEPPLFEFIIDAIARVTDGARMRAHRRRDASDAIDAVASDAADAIGNRDGTGADETRKRLNVRRLVTHFVTLKLFH